ncbi:hypothetical protein BT67DRAFT_8416 [Trichocladium antarcticum]|uniref:Uncharacterized protein n=1 Tax=Trichocladium antarcticum TaxID=1450529 RepID=A0AAN6UTK7_9PEZI|nr:hypothetical protein BT67DRAFT_8416 [Trichocladium antarcticum]
MEAVSLLATSPGSSPPTNQLQFRNGDRWDHLDAHGRPCRPRGCIAGSWPAGAREEASIHIGRPAALAYGHGGWTSAADGWPVAQLRTSPSTLTDRCEMTASKPLPHVLFTGQAAHELPWPADVGNLELQFAAQPAVAGSRVSCRTCGGFRGTPSTVWLCCLRRVSGRRCGATGARASSAV